MAYTTPTQVPGTYQSRPDSAPNKPYNCGPASVTHIVRFYKDVNYGINKTRLLGCPHNGTGTLPYEREIMLDKRYVSSKADRYSVTQLISFLRQKRYGTASFKMSLIPYPYRRYAFSGLHEMALVAIGSGTMPSLAVMDPNYGWPDGTTGYLPKNIWLPYNIWTAAFRASGGWAVIADKPKTINTRRPYVKHCTVTSNGVNVRTGPGTNYTVVASLTAGTTFTSTMIETAGGAYVANGVTRRDWLAYVRSGKTVWVARAFVREA